MFEPNQAPRIMALPVGYDFSAAFIAGLRARMAGCEPGEWARITIFVNTRRSARRLSDLLSTGPAILPNIRVIGDLAKDPFPGLPQPANALERQLLLADLIGAFLDKQSDLAPKSARFDLAKSLAALLDELDGEGLEIDSLKDIEIDGQSGHWQRNLMFLNILKDYVAALGTKMSGAEARQRAVIAALAAEWQENPVQTPVIIAGSTGSRGATALLIKAVANLPQGAVVLPGFDFGTPPDIWKTLSEEHPQFGFAKLAKTVGFEPADMPVWHDTPAENAKRNALASLSLRPAPVTAQWLVEGPKLLPDLAAACRNLTLLEAPNPRLEATAIAIKLRESLHQGKKAALVTPDRLLARRVSAMLHRWNITPDDSAGQPAQLSPPGIFLRMIVAMFDTKPTPLQVLELLKHPLCSIGARGPHLQFSRNLERKELRGGPAFVDFSAFRDWAEKAGAKQWLAQLSNIISPLQSLPDTTISGWAKLHRQIAESLGSDDLWGKEAGRVVLDILESLGNCDHQTLYSATDYRGLFANALTGEIRDDPVLAHPDIAIWGTLEARVQSADLIILAGLNEGIWPQASRNDTWLNREMRRQIGLELPERRIGLSAHDYQQCLGAAQVVLSRAIRDGEAPTVASRWLIRLQNLTAGLGEAGETTLNEMQQRGQTLLHWATNLDASQSLIPPAARPAPAPPISTRPKGLFVTRIETLIRDPYAIYARYILNLRKFEPLTQQPDYRGKGNVLHDILERFISETMQGLPDNPALVFDKIMMQELEKSVPWPATRRLWRAGFLKTRDWFLETEIARRQTATPARLEATGKRILPGGFELRAKADRIDIDAAGNLLIYDYKSGSKPSEKQIRKFSVQLPLEGVIAQNGGFDGINPAKIRCLQLIYLGGDGDTISFAENDDAMENAWENLCSLITRYQSENVGYPARLRPDLQAFEGDFDHLSRRGEWQDDDVFLVEIL